MMAFDTNLAPIVGQQITLTTELSSVALPRIQLMMARATATECDLVAKVRIDGREVGFLFDNHGGFVPDRHGAPPVSLAALVDVAQEEDTPITFTCVPPGSGVRIALDRYGNGMWDGDDK